MHLVQLSSFSLVATTLLVSAAPLAYQRRTAALDPDITVFKFADVLEQLESEFYSKALAKFQSSDFTSAGFSSSQLAIEQFTAIQSDEATHSSTLQEGLRDLGATPITSCKFDFSSVLTDVKTMAATARVVEAVGVSAYLGGATLMTDPILLDKAGSILTVEARHQTILNIFSGHGTAIPSAFDFPLTPSEVLAVASPFFDGACDVGIPANPVLSVTNNGTICSGTQLSFSSPAINSSTDTSGFFCQMLVGDQPTTIPFPFDKCVVPPGINGPVAIFVTSDGQPLINNVINRATATSGMGSKLVAGPLVTFVDAKPQILGQIIRNTSSISSSSSVSSSSSSSSSSTNGTSGTSSTSSTSTSTSCITTQTISPSQASAIISSAVGATASASASEIPSSY